MGEELVEGDGLLVGGRVGEELADGVSSLELALHFELEDGGGSELLGDGADGDDAVRGHGRAVLAVGETVAFVEQDLVTLGDEGHAGEAEAREAREVIVELGVLGEGGGGKQCDCKKAHVVDSSREVLRRC